MIIIILFILILLGANIAVPIIIVTNVKKNNAARRQNNVGGPQQNISAVPVTPSSKTVSINNATSNSGSGEIDFDATTSFANPYSGLWAVNETNAVKNAKEDTSNSFDGFDADVDSFDRTISGFDDSPKLNVFDKTVDVATDDMDAFDRTSSVWGNMPKINVEKHVVKFVDTSVGNIYERNVTQSIIIGKDESCDVVVDEPAVSRRHCRISRQGELYFIEDLQSSNGTNVDGLEVTTLQVPLNDGAKIRIGRRTLSFEVVR